MCILLWADADSVSPEPIDINFAISFVCIDIL